jgi:putative endonuclease
MYYTYILFSEKLQKFYTGSTHDIDHRLKEHNNGKTSFTRKGIPWVVLYSATFQSRTEAVKHENQIKKRGAKRFLTDIG